MKPKLVLRSSSVPELELESIDDRHLEFLRQLKNQHRHRFFHRDEISPAQQQAWYSGYCERPDDWLFVIRYQGIERGCLGYRFLDGAIDLYNFLRTDSGTGGEYTHPAFDLVCCHAAASSGLAIRGRVLDDNPFLDWIQNHGFVIIGHGMEAGLPYQLLQQDPILRVQYPVTVESAAMTDGPFKS